MTYYDITVPLINEMPTYPGDPGIKITDWRSLANGDAANVSHMNFGAHTGTHIDAPAHFIKGAPKIESLDLEVLIGEATVVEVPDNYLSIDADFVDQHLPPAGPIRVLFKTRNSAFWSKPDGPFRTDFTYLELSAAKKLVERNVKLIGIDYLSIEKFAQENHETHLELLSNGVVIVEGLNLASVPPGNYELVCLPLRIRSGQGDGSPARAVLRTLQ
ncbi:MAG TPA: cyclase family protein [Pyrinomonadaceae bacterium]|nr:cyclase family protein [Pyrinomonadaceae bacterium]